jgi:hypothetical protein
MQFYQGDAMPESVGPDGRAVEFLHAGTASDEKRAIETVLIKNGIEQIDDNSTIGNLYTIEAVNNEGWPSLTCEIQKKFIGTGV